MTRRSSETQHHNFLLRKFGTTDILEILGPAGTIPPTQTICSRLIEFGLSRQSACNFAAKHIPCDLMDKLKPYQSCLTKAAIHNTFEQKYGGHPMSDPVIREKVKRTNLARYGSHCSLKNPIVHAKSVATCVSKFGSETPFGSRQVQDKAFASHLQRYGAPYLSLTPDEVLRRLAAHNLEPLESIVHNSDQYSEIKVRCKICGREFTTRWVTCPPVWSGVHGKGFKLCECQTHGAKLEWFARDYVRSRYYPSAYQWSNISWMDNKEIDVYISELKVGFEINGYFTHNSEQDPYTKGPGKSTGFHKFKSDRCLEHGIKLYHFWYDADTLSNRERLISFIDGILQYQYCKPSPGDKVDRDTYPDPTEAGIPYTELPPEPFDTPYGVCYNSGYWQF